MASGSFSDLQYRFTAHMRDPARNPGLDDVEDRRLQIYRDLLYKNVEGFMANSFPVLRKIFDDERWHAMIRDYFSRHQSRTPLFPKMPLEFLQYLATERDAAGDPAFVQELAHYEWLEVEISLDTREIDDTGIDARVELLDAVPIANPISRPHAYAFPVHRIGPDFQPQTPPAEPTYLVVFRNRADEVSFMALNAVSARLLDLLIENTGRPGLVLLQQIAAELNHSNVQTVIDGGHAILETFLAKDIVLGTQTPHSA